MECIGNIVLWCDWRIKIISFTDIEIKRYFQIHVTGVWGWTHEQTEILPCVCVSVLYKVWSQLKRAIFHHFPDGASPPPTSLYWYLPCASIIISFSVGNSACFQKIKWRWCFWILVLLHGVGFKIAFNTEHPLTPSISTNFQSQHVQLLQGLEEVFWIPKDINLKVNSIMATGECFPGIPVCEKENSLIELSLKTAFALRYLFTDKEYQGCQKT